LRVRVRPGCLSGCGAMAIAAHQLHLRSIRALANRLHVQLVVQLDRSRIVRILTHRGELRVPIFKAANTVAEIRRSTGGPQIAVASRTSLIARRREIHAALVLHMAGTALEFGGARRMMRRPVMAPETSTVLGLRGKRACLLQMAR